MSKNLRVVRFALSVCCIVEEDTIPQIVAGFDSLEKIRDVVLGSNQVMSGIDSRECMPEELAMVESGEVKITRMFTLSRADLDNEELMQKVYASAEGADAVAVMPVADSDSKNTLH